MHQPIVAGAKTGARAGNVRVIRIASPPDEVLDIGVRQRRHADRRPRVGNRKNKAVVSSNARVALVSNSALR